MKADKYLFDGSRKFKMDEMPTDAKKDDVDKEKILEKFAENKEKMALLQDALFSAEKEGIVFVIQSMDASGKDSLIRHSCDTLNPQGVTATAFKKPSEDELAHDYLWRVAAALPKKGHIAIFNRSHYEDVVTVQVNHLKKTYNMADRIMKEDEKEFFRKRYRQIRDFEEYLYENSYRVVKIFLNVSKKEQKKRFLERIDRPEKNWKFRAGDLDDRDKFSEFMDIFEEVIEETATKHSPWYVIPADNKWYTRYLFTEIVLKTLEDCKPAYPELPEEEKKKLAECRERLMNE